MSDNQTSFRASALEPWGREATAALRRLFDARPELKQKEFGKDWDIGSPGMVSQYLTGKRPIRLQAAIKFARGLGVPVADISPRFAKEIAALTQIGQVASIPPSGHFGTPTATQTDTDLVIPQYAAGGSMGNGLVLEEKQPGIIKSWHVDQEWLRLNVKSHTGAKNLCIVTGFGPSMRPLYNPGDPLLLDSGVKEVESEGVFFFRIGDHGYIKQLQRIPVGRETVIRAKSLNPTYDPFNITSDMDFEVFGKVLTVWKSEQV